MARRLSISSVASQQRPKVRIARPAGRPYQLRYFCPIRKKDVRQTTSTRDELLAEQLRAELEAKLLLGIVPQADKSTVLGPGLDWQEFREHYRTLHLATLRDGSAEHSEVRLDVAERILKVKKLGDLADPNKLHRLQARLLAGECSQKSRPRSPHTVRSYMAAVLAALRWAYLQGWLPEEPRIRRLKVSKLRSMKGRPLTDQEVQQLLNSIPEVVGDEAASSWEYLIRGLLESALRLDELMHVSWDFPHTIRPVWPDQGHPLLDIPAGLQKNDVEESIPLLPSFEDLLLETPSPERTGWVFGPKSLQLKLGRKPKPLRPTTKWVGRIISRIGKAANIVVKEANPATGSPAKYASAHDLRRTCAQRLRDAGVPPLVICRVMRHSSWETTRKHYAPGDVQHDAQVLRSKNL